MTADPALQGELSGLGLNLAEYLAKAGQASRLMRLFRDDRWLRRRFDPELGNWDGYQADLEAAWDALDQELATEAGPATGGSAWPDVNRRAARTPAAAGATSTAVQASAPRASWGTAGSTRLAW